MTTQSPSDNRRTFERVNAGFPGRLTTAFDGKTYTVRALVIDISAAGARIIVNRAPFDNNAEWRMRQVCEFDFSIGHQRLMCGSTEVLWIQRERDQFDILGIRFLAIPETSAEPLRVFIEDRLSKGQQTRPATEIRPREKPAALETRLKASAQRIGESGEPEGDLIRCFVTHTGHDLLMLESYTDEAGQCMPLPVGERVLLSVHPPSWSGLSFRSLRLEVFVAERTKKCQYIARYEQTTYETADVFDMLQCLVPPEREIGETRRTVNVSLALFILFFLILLLLIFR